jgi:FtsH-binding integral membrane protein
VTSSSARIRKPLTRAESATLSSQTMALLALTTAAFALHAYVARNISTGWSWLLFMTAFITPFAVSAASNHSKQAGIDQLPAFGLLIGAAVAPTISYYANSDPQALRDSGGATALFIIGFGTAGYGARRDLSKLGRITSWAFLGLILFGVVTIFAQMPNGLSFNACPGLSSSAG